MPQIASKLASQSSSTLDNSSVADGLNSLEVEVIDLFVNAVKMLGFPKSVGEIYGLLFISRDALPLDALVERLSISKGSASQGLRLLKSVNAVKSVYVAGDRRDHFKAETQLKKLAGGFIREELEPHLASGGDRIARLKQNLEDFPSGADEVEVEEFYNDQIEQLERWHTKGRRLLPLIAKFLD